MEDIITTERIRESIEDYVNLINREKEDGATPTKYILNFRDWQINNDEVDVYKIKTEHLRFRKDNGRISSDVETYERSEAPLEESSVKAQRKLKEFLWDKSPEKIKQLMSLLKHSGQLEPAIITCDGFLVNGNRRKLALEKLHGEEKDEKFLWMKVVILPENTKLKEIEEVENRYQYQSDGKEDYTNFDKALSMRRKEQYGMSLEIQMMDDPEYFGMSQRLRSTRLKKIRTEFLGTLECIDAYLDSLGRSKMYRTVTDGPGDRDGRWEAFLTFNKSVYSKLKDTKDRVSLSVQENETGKVMDVGFKIIRKRDLKTGRLNDVMRDFPKILKDKIAKKEIMKLSENTMELSNEEKMRDGSLVDEREQDKIWGGKFGSIIINQVKKARDCILAIHIREKPIDLLKAALKKLEHEDLDVEEMDIFEYETAMEIAEQIQLEAAEIHKSIDGLRMRKKQLSATK